MASYQDIEQRLQVVEEQLSFLFRFMRLMKDTPLGQVQVTLQQIYQEAKQRELEEMAKVAAGNRRARLQTGRADESNSATGVESDTDTGDVQGNQRGPDQGRQESFADLRARLRSEGVI